MKFYYGDKLVRTSKNHIYTHAVIDMSDNNACLGCRASKETAEAIITTAIHAKENGIKECKTALKALEAGKKGYWVRERGHSYPIYFKDRKADYYIDWMESCKESIKRINENWVVVELEAR